LAQTRADIAQCLEEDAHRHVAGHVLPAALRPVRRAR
jgi:hypothetical protein